MLLILLIVAELHKEFLNSIKTVTLFLPFQCDSYRATASHVYPRAHRFAQCHSRPAVNLTAATACEIVAGDLPS